MTGYSDSFVNPPGPGCHVTVSGHVTVLLSGRVRLPRLSERSFIYICASLFVEVLRRFQSGALILIEPEIEALKAWEKKRTLADQRAEGKTRLKSFWFCECFVEKSQGNSERSKQRDCNR